MLTRIHEGHQGIVRCRARARESVWWPGISRAIVDIVDKCAECAMYKNQAREPMLSSQTPELPWQKVAADLFQLDGVNYLLLVDYRSRYPEVAILQSATSAKAVIERMKSIFARHGIPEVLVTDNGPQFSATEFKNFAQHYGFQHITTSPRYPQANGEIERMVKTIKSFVKKSADAYLALLNYCNTPGPTGLSPAQLLMGRRLRSRLPMYPDQLKPRTFNQSAWKRKDQKQRQRQKRNYDRRHRARPLAPLEEDDPVWLPELRTSGTVVGHAETPRSLYVETSSGTLRRNRSQVIPLPQPQDSPRETSGETCSANQNTARSPVGLQHTRSGRIVRPPKRLGFDD